MLEESETHILYSHDLWLKIKGNKETFNMKGLAMGNVEAFLEDYVTYRTRKFSKWQATQGAASIIFAATGVALTGYALFQLGTFVFCTVIPGLQGIAAAIGVTLTPQVIAYGVRSLAQDDSWSQMDFDTRMNIIAGIDSFRRVISLDISGLLED